VLEAGETTLCFIAGNVLINDNFVLEAPVSFTLNIDSVEPFDSSRVIISQDTLEIFILDDDSMN
jgi:hypothetical protein